MCRDGAREYIFLIFSKVVTVRDPRRFVGDVFDKADIFVLPEG